jgi:hypothetical protein
MPSVTSTLPIAMPACQADALSIYQQLLPAEFFDQLRQQAGMHPNNRIYTIAVVMWLMITQRLQGHGSLESAVLELLHGLPASFWPQPCKRRQDFEREPGSLSSHTGAYNKARQQLPMSMVEACFDRAFEQLTAQMPAPGPRAFFFDGTSVRMPHTPSLCERYPPGSNQHGESHWPLLRMLVVHDLETALAMRPERGPMYGPEAVSEQGLLEKAIERLPPHSVVVGDANFGVFSVAFAACQRHHPVILRLTAERARRLASGPLEDAMDRPIQWMPSRDDRRNHPEVPVAACVAGRLIVRQVAPSNRAAPFLLALFTTLDWGIDQIVQFYGKRWNIELDLRSLKSTLRLDQLTCTTPEMVAKELNLAMFAYNLVRAVTYLAAQKVDVPPRRFSFTRVRNVINAFGPEIANCQDQHQARNLFARMMYYVGQAQLPRRTKNRPSYPREVWSKPQNYPKRKA